MLSFFLKNLLQKSKKKILVNLIFSHKFTRNFKNYLDMLFLNFWNFNTQPCEFWSRVSSRVKKIIIANLVISLVPYHLPAMHSFHPMVMKKRAKLTSFFITWYEFISKEVISSIKVWRLEKTTISVFPQVISVNTILFK